MVHVENDFLNGNAPCVNPKQGPREPWHDIHSKVEGPIAYDIFQNFKERWEKQGNVFGNLVPIEEVPVGDIDTELELEDTQKSWNVQFFRSITSDSAVFKPDGICHVIIVN